MPYPIATVSPGSIAQQHGLLPGDLLLCINGEPVLDQIDYQFLIAQPKVELSLSRPDGSSYQVTIKKPSEDGLGLTFDSDLMAHPRKCTNRCVFCFIAQQPPGLRPSLYVEDDDWRLSLILGNFITLTNLPAAEIDRIIARRASPLYISVHTTDPALRTRMMGNPRAANLLPTLRRFAAAGIDFHCQIVACPGLNDGEALDRTLADLSSLSPHARSVAVVPVGLTRHREGLTPLIPFDERRAQALLHQVQSWQQRLLPRIGTRFVFAADELYLLAGVPLPPDAAYEDYAQIENGVGMLRQLEDSFLAAAQDLNPLKVRPARLALATGTAAAPFLRGLIDRVDLSGVTVDIRAIRNDFFGEHVTVSGLVVGSDLMAQLQDVRAERLLLPCNMLRAGEPVFLDGTPLSQVQQQIGLPITIVGPEGYDLLDALCGIAPLEE